MRRGAGPQPPPHAVSCNESWFPDPSSPNPPSGDFPFFLLIHSANIFQCKLGTGTVPHPGVQREPDPSRSSVLISSGAGDGSPRGGDLSDTSAASPRGQLTPCPCPGCPEQVHRGPVGEEGAGPPGHLPAVESSKREGLEERLEELARGS